VRAIKLRDAPNLEVASERPGKREGPSPGKKLMMDEETCSAWYKPAENKPCTKDTYWEING
jgi:hypothetical protein